MEAARSNLPGSPDAWLAAIVQSSDDAIVGKTLDGTIISWNPAAERLFGYGGDEAVGQKIFILAPPGYADEIPGILDRIRRGERIERFETIRRRKDGKIVPVSLTISPVFNVAGEIIGASKIARDITERKAFEERLRLLIAEIEHRSRNQLTLVCSLLRLTRAETIDDFRSVVTDRVIALQRATDHLARNDWRGADLHQLLRNVLDAFRVGDDRISIQGPTIFLPAEGVRAVAMAAHELATNALKYGALSAADGRITIRWRQEAGDGGALVLAWIEHGGPETKEPARRGLGLSVIELSVTKDLRGTLNLDWSPSGLRCEITIPAALLAAV